MDFFTPVELPSGLPPLVQADSLLLMGSCFATNMGSLLADAKFHPDINPFGVLYNPLSISAALREVVAGKVYKEENLFFFRECWHSPMHHGDFSSPSMEETLQRINARLLAAHECVHHLDCLMLTFGTSWCTNRRLRGMLLQTATSNRNLSLFVADSVCRRLYPTILPFSPV